MDYVVVDISRDAVGRAELMALGVRHVPVVRRGSEYVFGQSIAGIARFVGLDETGHRPLAPGQLIERWLAIFSAAQAMMRAMPAERLDDPVAPGREGPVRAHGYHVFRIGHAFIEAVEGRAAEWVTDAMQPPVPDIVSGADVADYGETIKRNLEQWRAARPQRQWSASLVLFDGTWTLHAFLERQVWHSAHHARQLEALLDRFGVENPPRLSAEMLKGLPLPEGVWN